VGNAGGRGWWKGWLIRAQQLPNKRISCKGQNGTGALFVIIKKSVLSLLRESNPLPAAAAGVSYNYINRLLFLCVSVLSVREDRVAYSSPPTQDEMRQVFFYDYSYAYCFKAYRYLVSPSAQDAMGLGFYTILLLPIMYAVYHTNGQSVRESCTAQ